MIKTFCLNRHINLKKDYGVCLYPWGTDTDNLQVLFLILKSEFISIHAKDFFWIVLLHSYSVNRSPRFLTWSSLSFRPLIYWIYLWTKFLPENMFYLYYIMFHIIWELLLLLSYNCSARWTQQYHFRDSCFLVELETKSHLFLGTMQKRGEILD